MWALDKLWSMREKNAWEPWVDVVEHHVMRYDQGQWWVVFVSALTSGEVTCNEVVEGEEKASFFDTVNA